MTSVIVGLCCASQTAARPKRMLGGAAPPRSGKDGGIDVADKDIKPQQPGAPKKDEPMARVTEKKSLGRRLRKLALGKRVFK